MRNDVEKMNNFQNVRISNKAINLIIFYVFLSFYFSKERIQYSFLFILQNSVHF